MTPYEFQNLEAEYLTLKHFLDNVCKLPSLKIEAQLENNVNIFHLSFDDKCLLYALWKKKLVGKLLEQLQPLEREFKRLSARTDEIRKSRYLYVARQAHVVGMTTTGAAEYHSLIQDLKPKIVIIEEAAEILEAHVVTSLSSSCEHLIMIGDHQQLKPSTAVYDLARNYNLEVSMFERMIENNLSYQTLEYQHRMRPEISRLLVPTIYEHLKDHSSVNDRPNIRGMAKNVFFLAHEHLEVAESDDNNSHSNEFEAKLITQLARHLVLQGYSTEQITILTPYSGQFFLLRKEMRGFVICQGIKICVVDNFQGEENDIILLSLVRSNENCNVGFLKIANRVCVALSRAKLGMYITGNLNQLCSANPELWEKIKDSLEEHDSVGDALEIKCQNHPEIVQKVKSGPQLGKLSPEGGCSKVCDGVIPKCGHSCPRICHVEDPNHEQVKCFRPCERTCEKRGHPCNAVCWRDCPPCPARVKKLLPCGHTHSVACSMSRKDFRCPTVVEKVIPDCEHKVDLACQIDPAKIPCPVPCGEKLNCGHACKNKCHVKKDPNHRKYKCEEDCPKLNKNCTGDHKCQLKCYEECTDCKIVVKKVAPCGHKTDVACSDSLEKYVCKQRCKRAIPGCGHFCKRKCSEPCGECRERVIKTIPECGHNVKVRINI